MSLVASKEPFSELAQAETADIYNALRELREREGNLKKILAFVAYLVKDRGEEQSVFVYETLLKANCNKDGSADTVRKLLAEMEAAGIEGTPAVYHSALRVSWSASMLTWNTN